MPKMSEAAKAKLNEFNEKQTDWYTVCPKCNAPVSGSLAMIREHRCAKEGAE